MAQGGGRRLLRLALARERKTRGLTYHRLGLKTGDPGSMQLQSYIHGRRSLPLRIAVVCAIQLKVPLRLLLTPDQRATVALVIANHTLERRQASTAA